ncbi:MULTISPECIES: LacI family DNA-binding transcriptional regulator [unclassified Rhizobium]|uniref:LacI family DNA-binding transcriptional regulator n=1 Tax=unclassified Rhizobium TaxID=2613769 RepID=UPI001AE60130|nr:MULTISPECIES: LacI family DNA-binding transcriptional regulator [unclassified Rhizobium]MBP2463863.1 LacI family transcriptional regulator [Rhizobium sp. PvP014]MBP2532090.1 LacI family transcriptional regulator [Rhizobium sp. PvP099]
MMQRTSKRLVTILDVAQNAGVAKATAARVLGNYGTASPEVREKVLEAAKKLGYQANELARSMTTGKSKTIGVIVGDIENQYFGQAVRGISDAARGAGFDVILANSGEDAAKEKAAVRVLLGKRVDGLIITPASVFDAQHLHDIHRSGRPMVLLDRTVPGLTVDSVVTDDRHAAEGATRALLEVGHRRIAYISATESDDPVYSGPHQINLSTVMNRIEGVVAASRSAGIEHPERYIRLAAYRRKADDDIIAQLLQGAERPTAILASDSVVALEVFKTVRKLGMSIPGDLSLVAFHDADWTSVTSPPITVIAQPVYGLGFESAQMLVQRISGVTEPPRSRVLATSFIQRQSIGPPPQLPGGRP